MGLRASREEVLAINEHGHHVHVIRWVGIAHVGIVVQEGVTGREVGMEVAHRLGLRLEPKMCTGTPSPGHSNWLSAVTSEQEKSRTTASTAERAVRNRVLVISRTMAFRRLASTAISTGSIS